MRKQGKYTASLLLSIFLVACTPPVKKENKTFFEELFVDSAKCAASQLLQKDLPNQILYEKNGSVCSAAKLIHSNVKPYYTDKQCTGDTVNFRETSYTEFCRDIVNPYADRVGNAASWSGESPTWTLSPSTSLGLGVLSLDGNNNPFMTREKYKSVEVRERHPLPDGGQVTTLRGLGTCDLEMRIFKKNIADENLKPLLAIHGGAWKYRGTAFDAFSSTVSHLTERGFVVFVPFYRLADTVQGNYECNNASWEEIVSDVEDALVWVQNNGKRFGAKNGKVFLAGGSAGGHLAAWLTVYHKEDIAKSLLFYPPVDFQHYFKTAQETDEELDGEKIIAGFLGINDVDSTDINHPDILRNTFTKLIEKNPSTFPPVGLIHGVSDTLVPSEQSVRMCNAYAGDIENGPAVNDGGNPEMDIYRKTYQCGNQSWMHLVAEGEHGMDSCVEEVLCPAGSKGSQKEISKTMAFAFDWIAE